MAVNQSRQMSNISPQFGRLSSSRVRITSYLLKGLVFDVLFIRVIVVLQGSVGKEEGVVTTAPQRTKDAAEGEV